MVQLRLAFIFAQCILAALGVGSCPASGGGGVSTAAVVTHAQGPSTEGGAITTFASGTATCAAYTICFTLPDVVLNHNSAGVIYRYHSTSQETATVTDDKSNTYTCISEVNDSTNNFWMGACYSLNLTNGPRVIKVALNSGCGASGCTDGQVEAAQLYNVTSFDTSSTHLNSATTTLSAGALTTTQTYDVIYQGVSITGTKNTSATNNAMPVITFGSGWSGVAADPRDGLSGQWQNDASSGSITPSETAASSVTALSVALAFKSGSQGTLPTGEYVACRGSFNSMENDTQSSIAMQIPCGTTGNVIHAGITGGGASPSNPTVSSITDGSNTWTQCVTGVYQAAAWAESQCAFNATLSNTEAPLFHLSWGSDVNADISIWWSVIAGANPIASSFSTPISGNESTGAATFTATSTYQPQASSALTINVFNQASNTFVSMSAPCAAFDATINGGENLSGPWQEDQNGAWGHCSNSGSNAAQTWTFAPTSSSLALAAWSGGMISFPASGAVFSPQVPVVQTGTGVTDIVASITTLGANDALIVPVGFYNGGTFTISKVSLDGNTTCSTGTQFTEFVNARSTSNGSEPGTGVWYLFNVSKGAHTVTVCASSSATNLEEAVYEVAGISATDIASHTNAGSVSGGNASGPSITTTGNPGFAVAIFGVSAGCTTVPASGNEYTVPGGADAGIFPNTVDGYMALVSTSAAAHSPACADTGGGTFNSSNAAFK